MLTKKHIFFPFATAVFLLFCFVFFSADALISNEPNAIDVVGQLDTSGSVSYLQGGIDNAQYTTGFNYSFAVELDSVNHRLFVADGANDRILVHNLDASNNFIDFVADNVLGQTTLNNISYTGSASQSNLNSPSDLAYDSVNNRLFVADQSFNRVLVYDVASITDGENAVYVLGQPDFTTSTIATTQSKTWTVVGVTYDPTNQYLYVSDGGSHRVLVFDVNSITNGENAINVLGQNNFTNSGFSVTQSGFTSPSVLGFDDANDRLFVANSNRVLVFDVSVITNGENAVNVLGQLDFTTSIAGTTQAKLDGPLGIEYDSTNDYLYVTDNGNNRVMLFDVAVIADGENAIKVLGQTDFVSSASGLTQSTFSSPRGLTLDSGNNRLYVLDRNNLRILSFDVAAITNGENASGALGQFSDFAATTIDYTKNAINNAFVASGLEGVTDSFVDSDNNRLFVADKTNRRVLVYNLDSNNDLIDHLPDNVLGQSDFITISSGVTQSSFGSPEGLAYDPGNNWLFVADRINHRVMVFDVSSITNGENAINVLGQNDFVSNGFATTQNGMRSPLSLDFDNTNDRLFVMDSVNDRVLIFNTASITDGENAVNVLGATDFTTVNDDTDQNVFAEEPLAVVYDANNNRLFVGDDYNRRVMVFDTTSIVDGENAVNVLGQASFTTRTTGLTSSKFSGVKGLAYDIETDRLFVSTGSQDRVLVFDVRSATFASSGNGYAANNVIGQPDFTTAVAAVGQAALNNITGLYYEIANDQLYVADSTNNRIMVFDASVPIASNITVSQTAATNTVVIGYDVNDTVTIAVDISEDSGATWVVTDTSVTGDLGAGISSGSGKSISWDAGTDFASQDQADMRIRIRATDSFGNETTANSSDFSLDTLGASGLTALSSSAQSSSQITLNWSAVTETNFDHYKIWYGDDLAGVEAATSPAVLWDNTADSSLALLSTTSTVIANFLPATTYYFKIWAVDSFGNETTVATFGAATTPVGGGGILLSPSPGPAPSAPVDPEPVVEEVQVEEEFVPEESFVDLLSDIKLQLADFSTGEYLGWDIDVSDAGDRAVVGKKTNYIVSGAAYVYVPGETGWVEQAELAASDAIAADRFGDRVVISANGQYVVVGAYGDDNYSGSAYVFEWNGAEWIEVQKIVASDRAEGDRFASSLSVSGDGNTIVVGAYRDDDNGANSGSVYVFEKFEGVWGQDVKLIATEGVAGEWFAADLAISEDADHLVVGASSDDVEGLNAGAAYVFSRFAEAWSQDVKITANDASTGDKFGSSVAISDNGEYVLVGAYGDDSYKGSAYLFVNGVQLQKITASDGALNDRFGYDLDVSGDGGSIVVGSYGDDDMGSYSGAVYRFIKSASIWMQDEKIVADDGGTGDRFGFSVAISDLGGILVGAYRVDIGSVLNVGIAYFFE